MAHKTADEEDYGENYWGGLTSSIKRHGIIEKAKSLLKKTDKKILWGATAVIVIAGLGGGYYLHSKNSFDTSSYTTEVPPGDSPSPYVTPTDTSNITPPDTENSGLDTSPSPSPTVDSTTLPDTSQSSFNANPTSLPADGSSTTTITITLKNSAGTLLAGDTVSLATSDTKASFKTPTTNITNSSGQVTFTMSSSNTGTDSVDVTATYQGTSKTLTGLGSVTFNSLGSPSPTPSGVVDQSHSSVISSPDTVAADGSTKSTITVTLKDSSGTAISGKNISLSQSSGPSGTSITSVSTTTDSFGNATFTVTSSNTGTDVFTATDTTDNIQLSNTASVVFQTPSSSSPSPSSS